MTIHRVLNLTLPDLNRALELIQKQHAAPQQTTATSVPAPQGGVGSSTGSIGPTGPAGPAGPAGADGIANLDLIVVSQNESELIIVDEAGSVVYDELGMAVRDRHITWDLVTDDYGNIITAE